MLNGRVLSLNCAGGGGRGILQAGYLNALADKNIIPDMVFGSSVGTLNACLYLQGDLGKLNELWMSIRTSDVYTVNYLNIFQLLYNKNCIFDNSPLKKLIKKYISYHKVINSKIPFYIGVTNLTYGWSEIYRADKLSEESFYAVVLASASVPIAFPPVELSPGVFYGDSGLTNNFNLRPAISEGADHIILLSPTAKEKNKTKTISDMRRPLTSVPEYGYLDREISYITKLNEYQDSIPDVRDIEVTVVKPDVPTKLELLDFDYRGIDRHKAIEDAKIFALSKLSVF